MDTSLQYNNLDVLLLDHPILSNYEIIKKLKFNNKRVIYHVMCNKTKKNYVIKFILKNNISDSLLQIYNFIKKTNHNNLVKIKNIDEDDNFLILVIDYIDGYHMNLFLIKNEISKKNRNKIIFKIIETISFLHENNIIHGDIKPENIMITKKYVPIIIDFDLSRYCFDYGKCKKPFGTKVYIAPEIYNDNIFYLKSDIWSFGITVFNSVIQDILYENKNYRLSSKININNYKIENILTIMNRCKKLIKEKIGNLLFNLIIIMIQIDIRVRPSSKEILNSIKKTKYYQNSYFSY